MIRNIATVKQMAESASLALCRTDVSMLLGEGLEEEEKEMEEEEPPEFAHFDLGSCSLLLSPTKETVHVQFTSLHLK